MAEPERNGASRGSVDPQHMGGENGPFRLDDVDRKILECLREDGRMNVATMARRVEVGQNTIKRRMERMERVGGLRLVPVIEPEQVGLDDCIYVGIKVEANRVDEVALKVRAMPEVRYLAMTTGPWDLLAEAFVGSRRHMADFLLRSVGELSGIVTTETFSVLKISKFGYEWEVPGYYEEMETGPEDEASNAHPS
jgi:Lrp/AsnC family transcriptional regulator for asnA, asnC and gidA